MLIVRIGAMGDVLHAMPAVAALRERHPDWFIGWAVEPRWADLLASSDGTMPLVDRVHRVPTREWKKRPVSGKTVGEIAGLRAELRSERYDVCVDMQGSLRSSVIGRLSGARLVGFAEPREGPAGFLYRQKVKVGAAHVVEQGCELLGAAVGEELQAAKVSLPVDAAVEAWCDALLERVGVRAGRFVFVAPTAGWGAKVWPAERYGAVAAELGRAGLRTLVNAVSDGDEVAGAVVRASEGFARAVPCSVGQMIALVRRAGVVIAGDTGPLHLAAALERPVVGLFGPTDPARNGPFGTRAVVLRKETSVTDHSRRRETEAGLMEIGVGEVARAALGLLR